MGFPMGFWLAICIQVLVFILMLATRNKMEEE